MEALVSNTGGRPTTDSLRVAKKFGKSHKTVLAAIRVISAEANRSAENYADLAMFSESVYIDDQNRKQTMFNITRDGFSLLVMGFTGPKALKFKIEFIQAFNIMENELKRIYSAGEHLFKHTERPVQIGNSKDVNHYNYFIGGSEQCIEYNRKNCLIHTGQYPNEIKRIAKELGIPSKYRSSAKEYFRYKMPDVAASMSVTDEFCKTGRISVEEAANLCKNNALPIFEKMLEVGLLTH